MDADVGARPRTPTTLMDADIILPYIKKSQRWCEEKSFAGWDPYDGMNSPLSNLLSLGTKYGRIAWTQFFRSCPVNFRPLFAIPARHNAKGIGLFLGAYSKLYAKNNDPDILSTINDFIKNLVIIQSRNWSGTCWGYPFKWQSRAALVTEGTPTAVNTAFIGHALLDCYEYIGSTAARDLALAIPNFIIKDLNRTSKKGAFCFSYTPLDHNFVHNANMLAASLLLRLAQYTDNEEWRDAAQRSMAYSIERQRQDGSWPYAETSFQKWIDSFHTGFNLESLRWFLQLEEAPLEWKEAYSKGVQFYADHFFLEDGTPKYYYNRVYPIDIHAPAEAVYFFSGEGEKYRHLTEKVLSWMLKNLWDNSEGYFYFRKTPLLTNKIPYMRWSQAWGMRAMAEYHVRYAN